MVGTKGNWICWLDNCSSTDVALVGGKGASLGELTRAGKNVPPGFAITVHAYRDFLARTGVERRITGHIEGVRGSEDHRVYAEVARSIGEAIRETPMPDDLKDVILSSYRELGRRCGSEGVLVAVRSSTTLEDSSNTSFAGQHDTCLNVRGEEEVLERVLQCWSSLYSAPALHYRASRHLRGEDALMAVVVQKMVNVLVSGVMFTMDPVSGDRSKMVIEGAWGLGEGIVSGYVTPDHFVVSKEFLRIEEQWISPKTVELVRDPATGKTVHLQVPPERQNVPCLTGEQLIGLARLGLSIEGHYGRPQDIEWALDRDLPSPENLVVLQSRPVTAWGGSP